MKTQKKITGLSKTDLYLISAAIESFLHPDEEHRREGFTEKGIHRLFDIDDRIGSQLLNIPLLGKKHIDKQTKEYVEKFGVHAPKEELV